jgi:arylsulfatase
MNKLISIILISSTAFLFGCKKQTKNEKPNVVIIFTDDQGYQDVGCFGAEGFETPNLDKMAQRGTKFTSFYVSEAVCSASRSSLLTGCYATRLGIVGAFMPNSSVGLNPKETTIAEMLKGVGYTTGMFGKWHLGHHNKFLPTQQGFDEYLGLPYSNDMWPVNYDGTPATEGHKTSYPPLPLIKDSVVIDTISTLDDQSGLTKLYTDAAVEFIKRNNNTPFFLYVPFNMPHVPIAASERFKGKSKKGLYGDVIMEIDWGVGEILKVLKENGVEENTLVIFTSDNGPWKNYGNHAGKTGIYREGKGNMFEGGVRVPCIMQWPAKMTGGQVKEQMAATVDILPTIAALTGAKLPEKKIDGQNLASWLFEGDKNSPRDEYYYYYEGGLDAVRKGDWKLMFPHRARLYEGTTPGKDGYPGEYNWKVVEKALYNLKDDPGETKNLIEQYPEKVAALESIAQKARKALGDQVTGAVGSEIREVGRLGAENIIRVNHLAKGKKYEIKYPIHPKYKDGDYGLSNGIKGSRDFNDGSWCGLEYENLELIIDLNDTQKVSTVSVGFMQDQGHWIFSPKKVEYLVSVDGDNFHKVYNWENDLQKVDGIKIQQVEGKFDTKQARFVKVIATNIKNCPQWHNGDGGRAWIFMDEVEIN